MLQKPGNRVGVLLPLSGERINGEMHYRIELMAHRDNLNLENPAPARGSFTKILEPFPIEMKVELPLKFP